MDKSDLLRTWATLGVALLAVRCRPVPDWTAAHQLIVAARQKLGAEAERLRILLGKSRHRLHPLEDPFDLDLGLHRWLAGEREEAYSDWLQWVIEQLSPCRVLRVFGIDPPEDVAMWKNSPPEIRREFCVPFGHSGQTGRLDLLVRYRDRALLVIEVKKVGAEEADTAKGSGYDQWLRQQPEPFKAAVLLAVTAEVESYENFRFVSWGSVCVELRRIACELCRESRVMVAAMILAFVAAVEQNVLGFSAALVRNVCEDRVVLFNATVVDHLARSLDEEA